MKRIVLAVAVVLALTANGFSQDPRAGVKNRYSHEYYAAKKRCDNKREVGRNIRKYGLRGGRNPKKPHYVRSTETLRALCRPQPKVYSQPQQRVYQASAPASGGTSGGAAGLPACASESGTNYSTGPTNTNASGATGRYQEMPMHRQPGGLCYGLGMDPAGQDACAEKIYKAQGASAWVGCGG